MGISGSASFQEGVEVQIGRVRARLRQFQIEGVNLFGTQVTNKQTGSVGSEAAPVTGRSAEVSAQILQIEDQFRAGLSDSDAAVSGMLSERAIVINVVPVGRPIGKPYHPGLIDPIRPLLRLEVEEQEFLGVRGHRGKVPAIRRPAGAVQVLGAGKGGDLARVEVNDVR